MSYSDTHVKISAKTYCSSFGIGVEMRVGEEEHVSLMKYDGDHKNTGQGTAIAWCTVICSLKNCVKVLKTKHVKRPSKCFRYLPQPNLAENKYD